MNCNHKAYIPPAEVLSAIDLMTYYYNYYYYYYYY
jgi:hypothetical protein